MKSVSASTTISSSPEEIFVRFEKAYLQLDPLQIEDVLPDSGAANYRDVLIELIRIELELTFAAAESCSLPQYLLRFPRLQMDKDGIAKIAFEEYRLRKFAGQVVTREEYQRQFDIDTSHWPLWDQSEFTLSNKGGTFMESIQQSAAIRDQQSVAWVSQRTAERPFPRVSSKFLGFELVGILGKGAFGRVYLARQDELAQRFVALKVTTHPSQEPQCLASLQHTNIMPIFSVHESGSLQAICMPFLGVVTLADLVKQSTVCKPDTGCGREMISTVAEKLVSTLVERTPDPASKESVMQSRDRLPVGSRFAAMGERPLSETAAWLLMQLADGLSGAHRQGIIHGDLKPANILISDAGQPLLLDFHLAQQRTVDGCSPVAGGTLPYMAPEQLQALLHGGTMDERSDIYSLGAVFYHLLSGQTPFPLAGRTWEEIVAALGEAHLRRPAPLRGLVSTVDPDLGSIVEKCMDPEPGLRYQSAQELHVDLQRHFENLPLRYAPNRFFSQRVRKWLRRHPRIASTSTVVAIAASVLAIALGFYWNQSQRLRRLSSVRDSVAWIADVAKASLPLTVNSAPPKSAVAASTRVEQLLRTRGQYEGSSAAVDRERALLTLEQKANEDGAVLAAQFWLGNYWLAQARDRRNLAKRSELLNAAEQSNSRASAHLESGQSPALILQKADILASQGDTASAEELRATASKLESRSSMDRMMLACQLRRENKNREAIHLLQQALAESPTDYVTWLVLGNAYFEERALADSEACFSICISLDSTADEAFFNRGLSRMERQDDLGAVEDFSEAIQRNRAEPASFANRAIAFQRLEEWQHSVDDFTSALDLGASETRMLYLRSQAWSQLGNELRAAEDLDAFLNQEPLDVDSLVMRGVVHLRNGDRELAFKDFETAAEWYPESVEAIQNKASILSEQMGQTEPAIELMSRLVQLKPLDATTLATRGVLHGRAGNRRDAIVDAQRALELNDGPDALYRVAGIYAQTSKIDAKDLEKAFQLLAKSILGDPSIAERYLPVDPDIEPLKNDARFGEIEKMLQRLESLATPDNHGPEPNATN